MTGRRGFTLIEVIIALIIMVGGMIVVGSSWSGNLLRVRKSNLYNNVAHLLERKAAELEAKYKGRPLTEIAAEEGDFGSDYPQYRWRFEVQPFEMPDLGAIVMGQQDTTRQEVLTLMSQMQEYLSKAIVEGKITVSVGTGENPVEFSVTNYFIDYNLEPTLPGAGP